MTKEQLEALKTWIDVRIAWSIDRAFGRPEFRDSFEYELFEKRFDAIMLAELKERPDV